MGIQGNNLGVSIHDTTDVGVSVTVDWFIYGMYIVNDGWIDDI